MTAHEEYRENLPLYAAGALTSSEVLQVELHLTGCSECRDELRFLNEAAAQIAMAVEATAPPAQLRERLLARLEDQDRDVRARNEGHESGRKLRPRSLWFWAPAFAAAILALVSVALWRHDREVLQNNRDLRARLESNDLAAQRARELIDALTADDAQHIALVATGAKPQPEAKAVYSRRQHSLVLLADNLNALPTRKIYELWLLPADGSKPVAAGTFKPDARGSATLLVSRMAGGVPAKGFAVTVEDEPGSASPTMPIILSGGA